MSRAFALRRLRLLAVALVAVVRVRVALTLRRTASVDAAIAAAAAGATAGGDALHDLREVGWSVAAAARVVPGATCLTQAMAGQWLLARRGRAAEVRLTLPAGDAFAPHAWLLSGTVVVLGGTAEEFRGHRPFRPVGAGA